MKAKRLIVFLVTIVIAVSMAVGVAFAADQAASRTIYNSGGVKVEVKNGNVVGYLTGASRGDFGVGISTNKVIVMRFDADGTSHVVFQRAQP